MRELKQLVDVNTNRACEGLRVLEDGIRCRPELAPWLDRVKGWRTDLRAYCAGVLGSSLDCRDAAGDPGPASSLRKPAPREPRNPFRVNAGRAQEALRALEEYYKVLAPARSPAVEAIRFQVYELEKAWATGSQGARRRALLGTDLYGITAAAFSRGRGNVAVARAMLEAGVRILQYREKDLSPRAMARECDELRRLTADAGALFLVNDHVDLALAVEADGVHVGQEDLPLRRVRDLIGAERILGLSTHAPDQARAAVEAGADYLGVGPLYATQTKRDVCAPVGLAYLDFAIAQVAIPIVAIGGIKRHNLAAVRSRGATLVALVTEITEAEDIGGRVQEIRAILHGSTRHD